MREMDVGLAVEMVEAAARRVAEREEELSRLDGAAGDGDHGANMTAALADARRRLERDPPADPAGAWRAVSGAFLEKVGGAAGGLFGAFFAAVASGLSGQPEPDADALAAAWRKGAEQVRRAGRAAPGHKTMLDALLPAVDAAATAADAGEDVAGTIQAAARAARRGAEATSGMRAAAGRARYSPERSQGLPDPGAVTCALLFQAWAEAACGQPAETT